MGPLVNGPRRGTVLGAEGEEVVGIVPSRTSKPCQTVRRRQLINIIVRVKVNAAQANVADLELGVTERCDLGGEVPLPAIGKVRVELDTLVCITTRAKVAHVVASIRAVRERRTVEGALGTGADSEWRIRAHEPGAGAADRVASEELPNSPADHPIPVTEDVICETEARRNQVVVRGNDAAILGVDPTGEAVCRAPIRRPRRQHNSIARRSAQRSAVSIRLKGGQLVIGQPCVRHQRPAEPVIQGQPTGYFPVVAEVELDIAPARIADRISVVLVYAPHRTL